MVVDHSAARCSKGRALWLHQSSLLKSCRLRHTFILLFSLFIIIFNRRHNYESWRYWRWHYGPGYC